MTDLFIYNKEDFGADILYYLKECFTTVELKKFIDTTIETGSATFRSAVYRRIISFRVGKEDWWLSMADIHNCTKIAKELVAIWKLVITMKRNIIYDKMSVEDYAHERLEAVEKRLVDGEINEQTYIEKCNWIKHLKEIDEAQMDCCSCCPIGSMNPHEGGEPVLRIMCLPCDWDRDSTCVRFV